MHQFAQDVRSELQYSFVVSLSVGVGDELVEIVKGPEMRHFFGEYAQVPQNGELELFARFLVHEMNEESEL